MKRNSLWFRGYFRGYSVYLSVVLLAFTDFSWGVESKQTEIGKRLDAAASVLREIMTTPDKAIPGQVLKGAKCIVVVPSIVKVALGIGARHCDPFIEKEACSAGASAVISKSKAVAALIASARSIFDEIAA